MSEVSTRPKRLFIGFPVPVESSLASALKKTKIDSERRHMEIQWIPTANYHVTLNFIGPTPADRINALNSVISEVAQTIPPLQTSLRGMGAFPDERHMRVLWVGVRRSRSLAHLQETLRTRLVEAGFHQEDRDYVPHLTVGRLRKARAGGDLLSPHVRTQFGGIDVSSVILFESVMTGAYVAYKALETFELTGTPENTVDETYLE